MAERVAVNPVARLRGVRIAIGGRIVQEDLTFDLEEGELVAVLGPNGAGKTSLLRVLLGLLSPSAGTVEVFGRPPGRGNARIGYVPQFRTLEADTAIRGRDLVRFGLDGSRWGPGWPRRENRERIDRVLREVDALELARRPLGQLSGGERQRVLLAQALVTDPLLLLMDEPFANLDMAREREIASVVNGIRRSRGVAVLIVTHDVNPLLRFADRILYLANGRSAIGSAKEVMAASTLSVLYGSPVEVVRAGDRLYVAGATG